MALMTWNKEFSVELESIDQRYSVLVATLNELYVATMKGQSRDLSGQLLRRLVASTRAFCSAEESILAKAKYPKLELHQAEHVELTRKVERYVTRFEQSDIPLSLHLFNFLRDWLTKHVQEEQLECAHGLHAHNSQ
jgi:hemerythrin